ncbi:hypothetical protein ACTA71_005035 [Dictyostelium dimigraforme]
MEVTEENNIDSQEVIGKPNFFKSFLFNNIPYLKTLPYPGRAEEIVGEAKSLVSDDIYDGAKIDVAFKISPYFENSHNFNAFTKSNEEDNNRIPKYSNSSVYSKDSTLLYGKIDNDRKLYGRFDQGFYNNSIKISLQSQMDNTYKANLNSELELKFPFMNLCFKSELGNSRGFSFLTSVSKKLSIGFENLFLMTHNASIRQIQFFVHNPLSTWSLVLNTHGQIGSSYVYRQKNLHICSDLIMGFNQEGKISSEYSFGFKYHLQQSLLKFRADSQGSVFGSYDQLINNAAKVNISGSLNYFTQIYKFGLGLTFQK